MKVSLVDLKIQYQAIKEEINAAVMEVFSRIDFILGDSVSKFEEEFLHFRDSKYYVGVVFGTDALYLALKSLGG